MRKRSRYFLNGSMIALLAWQSGCGAIQSGWHGPNTDKEDWQAWEKCQTVMASPSTGIKHDVFCLEAVNSRSTNLKPPVLLLHELTGLTPQTFRYAMELSNDFTVYIPMLFGEKGETSFLNLRGLSAYWSWFGNEWSVPSKGSAPIVRWLRDVVSNIEQKHGSSPIRIIGNCMTGALPLALLSNANIDAVVLAQPALPMRFWWWRTKEEYGSLDLSSDDLAVAQKSKARVLALRFETDWISHSKKLETLGSMEWQLTDQLNFTEICASKYDPKDKKIRPHSTLIGEYDAVQDEVRKQSKNAREMVRNFLLDPTHTIVGKSKCS